MWSLFCGQLLSLVLHYFLVMTSWFLYLLSLLDVENIGDLWRLDERDVSCSDFATGFAYLCGWSLVLHGFTFFVLLSVDSVCRWFFRFDIIHAVGVLVCVWSSSTGLHIELEVAVYGLVMLLAWVFWCSIPLRYGWLDELAFTVDAIFNLVGSSVGLDKSVWLLFWLMFYLVFWRMTSQFCWAKKLIFLMLLCSSWAQWSGGSVCSLCYRMDLMLVLFGQVSSWSTRAYVMIYVVLWMAVMI